MANSLRGADAITDYNTYEEFLDSHVTQLDLFYLEDEEFARELVEIGHRGNGEVLKLEEFLARKQAVEANRQAKKNQLLLLGTTRIIVKEGENRFINELCDREDGNRNGIVSTIIFIRDINNRNQEVSGYIDYAHRLKVENFEIYFTGKKKLMPKPSDLSFFNWETQMSTSNSTPNYQVITDNPSGLLFRNRRDRKIVNVDPRAMTPGENSIRVDIKDAAYLHVVIFDHISRRKS